MIRLLKKEDLKFVLDYLYQEPSYNIFAIVDIETFGFDNDFLRVYGEFDDFDNYLSIFLRYREFGIYYSHLNRFNKEYKLIFESDPSIAYSCKSDLSSLIEPYLNGFEKRRLFFCKAKKIKIEYDLKDVVIKEAKTPEEFGKLYDLMKTIDEFDFTTRDSREKYIETRMSSLDLNTSLYIEENEKIISTVAISAETKLSAMVVGVATDKAYRNKGLASKLLLRLMEVYLYDKNKELCLFYDNPEAGKIYLKLGFEKIGYWDMFQKNK